MDIENKELFRGKYRIKSARCPGWDYSSYGYYFVTICTKDRQEFLGKIRNGIMGLNEMGCIAAKCLQEIHEHFPNVILDEWVVMPNHVHAILFLNNSVFGSVGTQNLRPYNNKKQTIKNFIPINLALNLEICLQSFGVLKLALKNMPPKIILYFPGNHVTTIASSAMNLN